MVAHHGFIENQKNLVIIPPKVWFSLPHSTGNEPVWIRHPGQFFICKLAITTFHFCHPLNAKSSGSWTLTQYIQHLTRWEVKLRVSHILITTFFFLNFQTYPGGAIPRGREKTQMKWNAIMMLRWNQASKEATTETFIISHNILCSKTEELHWDMSFTEGRAYSSYQHAHTDLYLRHKGISMVATEKWKEHRSLKVSLQAVN